MGVDECDLFLAGCGRVWVSVGKCGWVWASARFITAHTYFHFSMKLLKILETSI